MLRNIRGHAQAVAEIDRLVDRGDNLNTAENELLELLTVLVEQYEDRHVAIPDAPPVEALRELMAARGTSQAELAKLIGSRGDTSEILNGKRSISKTIAKKLADHFHVFPAVFYF